MRKADVVVPVKAVGYEELTDSQRVLIDAARSAAKRAYAPYSHFSVGAALLLDNGEIVEGSNQENAAYPSGCVRSARLHSMRIHAFLTRGSVR